MTTEPEEPKPPPKKENPRPWPTYSYDDQRRHISPYDHRPPYRRLWTIDAHDTLEFPPTVGYGKVYLAQQKGLFFALDDQTGRVHWRKSLGRCAASSPTIGKGVVYVSYMHPVECLQGQEGADGFVVAWDADTGREKWRFNSAPIESSPLLKGNRLFVGSWDHGVYALNANNGKRIWRFEADNEVNTSAAYWNGRIFIASDSGTIYSLSAKTGKLLWSEGSAREFYYATPTVAHGRVYIGSTDGTMYVFGAKTGRLLWARPLGSYIYGAAAVYQRKVFVGTYDGQFYALDAATGDTVWQTGRGRHRARGADRDGRPRLLRDLLDLRLGGPARGGGRLGRDLRGARQGRQGGLAASPAASTRTRWWRTTSASTSRAARSCTRSRRRGRRRRRRTSKRDRRMRESESEREDAASAVRRVSAMAYQLRDRSRKAPIRSVTCRSTSSEASGSPSTWSE